MTVKKLYNDTYYADYRESNGARRRVSLQTQDLQEAQAKYEAIIQKRDAEKKLKGDSMYWTDFKDKVLAHLATARSTNTVTRTKIAARYLEDVIHPFKVCDVTPKGLQKVQDYMVEQGLGEHNINRLLQCIKTMMRLGEEWNLVEWQDWRSISKLKAPKKLVEVHSAEEIDKLLAACPTLEWQTIVLLAADAGLRREEIMNLRWKDVDNNNDMIYIDMPEKDQVRTIPTTDCLKKQLANMRKKSKSEFVISEVRNHPHKDYISIQYVKMAREAGITSTIPKLRHTYACELARKGINLYALAKLLGITPLTAQETYGAFMPKVDVNAIISGLPIYN